MEYKRIILFKGAVETLEYFSEQLAQAFIHMGKETMFWNLNTPEKSLEEFFTFYREGETLLCTFNFIGLSGEEQFETEKHSTLWEKYKIPCWCMMVDHPMYYYKQLSETHGSLNLICIDRGHCRFVEEFYPRYSPVHFLPLGGTKLLTEPIPYEDRDIDILFAGNYVALPNLEKHLVGVPEDNKEFYFEIIEDLIQNPDLPMDTAILKHLRTEIPKITRHETLACMYHMIFVDLYVRSYFRRELVCSLAEAGMKVTVLGKDWELSGCKRPENLNLIGQVDSLTCLEFMQRAKISFNVMPWFKEGAHDRIFNSMLSGCVTVTDSSLYLDEILHDHVDFAGYTLKEREKLPEIVQKLLQDREYSQKLAQAGYDLAQAHTWEKRAEDLNQIFLLK